MLTYVTAGGLLLDLREKLCNFDIWGYMRGAHAALARVRIKCVVS